MTVQNSPATAPKSTRPAWLSGCITIFAILFAILGIWDLAYGSIIAYVFAAARILSPAKVAVLLIIVGDCLIYFFLAARIKQQPWFISAALLLVVWLVLPISLRVLLNSTTMRVRNDGFAMLPELSNGEYLLADRQAYQHQLPQRGDVVLLSPPSPTQTLLIKRIIGLPGEVVTIAQGQVLINGTPLNEAYISSQAKYQGEWKVTEGNYFVLGDNRNDSRDSHIWGLLPYENIVAKVVWVYWPLPDFGKIATINFAQ